MINPLVSIIIPTFNRAHLIGETLNSILSQIYQNWDCIIVDDGSTDNTAEVVNEYIEKDKRFKLYYRPSDRQPGGNAARNYGFEVSSGEYVKWFDSDDIMYPEFLQTQVTILTNDKSLDFCACQWEYFYEDGTIAKNYINLNPKSHPLYAYFLDSHVFATPSPLWKRTFLANENLFDVNLFRSQEADFHFRMLSLFPNYLLHEDFLYKVRRGHDSIEKSSSKYKAKLSVLKYFQKAFRITEKLKFEGRKELLSYLIFRNVSQLYVLVSEQKKLYERIKFALANRQPLRYFFYLGVSDIIRLSTGLFLLVFFGKGYVFLNFKRFDLRRFKKNILLVGPIGNFGGRELESGFICSVLSPNFKVDVLTTGIVSRNSQIFEFDKKQKVYSLKDLVYKKFITLKICAFISYLKNNKKFDKSYYVNNLWAKKYLNYDNKIRLSLIEKIKQYDLIFISAQLTSSYLKIIIEESKKLDKKIVFRTTGRIQQDQNFTFLNQVDLFIHHSENNANQLKIENHNYRIIDQCAFNEIDLIQIPLVGTTTKHFLTLGRVEQEKNMDIVVKSFLKVKSPGDVMYVVGSGSQLEDLIKIANNDKSIIFTGFIPNNKLNVYLSKVDCVIIPHYDLETGPLSGIEAMAAGKLLISAKTGAMPERLKDIEALWFDNSVQSLSEQIIKMKKLNDSESLNLSSQIRNRYNDQYSKDIISKKYQDIIKNLMSYATRF